MKLFSVLLLIGSMMPALTTLSAETIAESKASRTHLLELFTSEGCSSCPPAETWMSKLTNQPGLWRDFVPVAFHVDYWDRLGWRDPFANKKWTERQQMYAANWNASSVYTPGFVLDGREWERGDLPTTSSDAAGVLKLERLGENSFRVSFMPSARGMRPLDVHVARLGFKLASNVTAGENRGRSLSHDFIVLALTDAPLEDNQAAVRFDAGKEKAGAIAAWITESGKLAPLQAAGGWLH